MSLPAPLVCLAFALALASGSPAQERSPLPVEVTGPPPAWIEPGLRLTYTTLVASIPDSEYVYRDDAGGRWVDQQGNRYRREEVAAQGSHGFLQADVVALSREEAAVGLRFYLFDGLDRDAPLACLESGYVAPAGTGGDLWLHPDALRQLVERGASGVDVRRVAYTIERATYEAVQLLAPRPDGRGVWVYDAQSGVLLFSSDVTDLQGQRNQVGVDVAAGTLQVRFTTFQSSRTLQLPWALTGEDPPAAVDALRYSGSFTVRQPGLVETPLPFALDLAVERRGPGYALLVPRAAQMPGLERRVLGAAQLGGGWLPLAAATGLRAGQELDRDPLTHVVTRVAAVVAGRVVLVQESPRQRSELTYRRSDGLLERVVAEELLSSVPGMRKVVELTLDAPR